MNYKKETLDFLKRVNANVKITPIGCEKPLWSSRYYSTYRVTISRNGKKYTYKYYDNNSTPNEYYVLSCLEKYDVGSYENFCKRFGYEMYDDYGMRFNKYTMKIYKAVVKEVEGVERVFGDVLEEFTKVCS